MVFDPSSSPPDAYTSMQQQAGILPPFAAVAPPTPFPGQVAMAVMQGMPGGVGLAGPAMPMSLGTMNTPMGMGGMGMGGMGGGMLPGFQTAQNTFIGGPRMFPGPGGAFLPMYGGAPANPMGYPGSPAYPAPGAGGIYSPQLPAPPPPAYAGMQGRTIPFPFAPSFLSPMPPPAHFETPFQARFGQARMSQERFFQEDMAGTALGARVGTNLIGGGIGAALGSRFGATGALVGGALGFLGSELSGMGSFGQNAFMNNIMAPVMNRRAYANGIEQMSRQFISSGPDLSESGAGFGLNGSLRAARGLEGLGGSSGFQRETHGRFNTADVFKISQMSGELGMMGGVQSPEQMVGRVREIAKSLQSFMELANEPDVQRALSTMANLRSSGLTLSQTTNAVANGRTFARMAGTTFDALASVGGAMGSQTYQSLGLSQGVGFQAGMGNYGQAVASQNMGILNPMTMGLLGGAQGLAQQNTMFSGGFLQMPMLAPAMMSANGGLNIANMQSLLGGRTDVMGMTGMAANNMSAMTGRMGVEGLGMALSMQPLIQSQIGQILEQQGPFARRNVEDQNVMGLMRQMGLSGSAGFTTAARFMGMSDTQAVARAQEMADPRYWEAQRDQNEVHRQERRAEELRRWESERPGMLDELSHSFETVSNVRRGLRGIGHRISNWVSGAAGERAAGWNPRTAEEHERFRRHLGSREFAEDAREMDRAPRETSFLDRYDTDRRIAEFSGASGLAARVMALGHTDPRQREEQVAAIRASGRMAEHLNNTTELQERQALSRFGETFGRVSDAGGAQTEFARRLANRYNSASATGSTGGDAAINFGVRAVGMALTRGVDVGNVVQAPGVMINQAREDFVSTMTRRGMGQDEAHRMFQQNSGEILQQSASAMNLYLNSSGRARMRAAITQAQGIHGGGGSMANARDRETRGYRALLGEGADDTAGTNRRVLDSITGSVRGVGRGERQAASRRLAAAMALYSTAIDDAAEGSQEFRDAQRQLDAVAEQARREGFSEEEIAQMRREAGGARDRAVRGENGGRAREVAHAFLNQTRGKSGQEVSRLMAGGERDIMSGAGQRHLIAGVETMGRRRGVLGEIFGGLDSGNFTNEALADKVGGVTEDQIRTLSRGTESERRLARLMQRFKETGSQEDMGAIRTELARGGRASDRARQRFRESNPFSRLFTAGQSVFDTEEDWANRALERGTGADDADADGSTNSAEDAARAAGIGGPNDQMARASSELLEAARLLRGAVDSGGLDRLLPNGD